MAKKIAEPRTLDLDENGDPVAPRTIDLDANGDPVQAAAPTPRVLQLDANGDPVKPLDTTGIQQSPSYDPTADPAGAQIKPGTLPYPSIANPLTSPMQAASDVTAYGQTAVANTLEPTAVHALPVVETLTSLGRLSRTFLDPQGDVPQITPFALVNRALAAGQAARPSWAAGTPQAATTAQQFATDIGLPDTAHDYSIYDKYGDIKWTRWHDAETEARPVNLLSLLGDVTNGLTPQGLLMGGPVGSILSDPGVSEFGAHVHDFVKNLAVDIATDPGQIALLLMGHFGLSSEEEALNAAKASSIADIARTATPAGEAAARAAHLTKFGEAAPTWGTDAVAKANVLAESAKYAKPPLGDAIRAGTWGMKIKPPFGREMSFLPAPKALAPLGDALEASGLLKPIPFFTKQGGLAYALSRDVGNRTNYDVQQILADEVAQPMEKWLAKGATPQHSRLAGQLANAMQQPEMGISMADRGLRFPDSLALEYGRFDPQAQTILNPGPRVPLKANMDALDSMVSANPSLKAALENATGLAANEGWQHFEHLGPTFAEIQTLPAGEQAMVAEMARDMAEAVSNVRARVNDLPIGPNISLLGKAQLARPSDIADLYNQSRELTNQANPNAAKFDPTEIARVTDPAALEQMLIKQYPLSPIARSNLPDLLNYTEHEILQKALVKEFPDAFRNSEAVSHYTPGRVSAEMRAGMPYTNPFVAGDVVKGAGSVEDAVRGVPLDKSPYTGKPYNLDGVMQNPDEINQEMARGGTGGAATKGTVPSGIPATLKAAWDASMTKQYLVNQFFPESLYAKALKAANPDNAFFEPNTFQGLAEQLRGPITADVNRAGTYNLITRTSDTFSTAAWNKVLRYVDGDANPTLPQAQRIFEDNGGQGLVENKFAPDVAAKLRAGTTRIKDAFKPSAVPWMRDAITIADEPLRAVKEGAPQDWIEAQKIFDENGGRGLVQSRFKPSTIDAVNQGKMSVRDALTEIPENPMEERLVHADLANKIQEWQKLGNDPHNFAGYIGKVAPLYKAYQDWFRSNQTMGGPGFLAHMSRTGFHDLFRSAMGEGIDGMTLGDNMRFIKPMQEFLKTGGTDYSVFRPYQIHLGDAMGTVDGETFMRMVAREGQLKNGMELGEIYKDVENPLQAQQAGRVNKWLGNAAGGGDKPLIPPDYAPTAWGGAPDVLKRFQAAREATTRANYFATRMRAGDSAFTAGQRTADTLFDNQNIAGYAQGLRATGMSPFAAWHSQVIPWMARQAITNPGEFWAIYRLSQAANNGGIPDSQLPEMAKGKYGLQLAPRKNAAGDTVYDLLLDTGTALPWGETRAWAGAVDNAAGGDPQALIEAVKEKMGAAVNVPWDVGQDWLRDQKDPEKRTYAESANEIAGHIIGKPYRTLQELGKIGSIDPMTGEPITAAKTAVKMILPTPMVTVNSHKEAVISMQNAKKAVEAHQMAVMREQQLYNQQAAGPSQPDNSALLREQAKLQASIQRLKQTALDVKKTEAILKAK